MHHDDCKIFIVDDDEAICRGISLLLKSAGYPSESFKSAEDLLENFDYYGIGCILLDIFLEGKNGLELQEEINNRCSYLPLIYITGMGDIPMSVQALKKGAINFLQKPIDDTHLLDAVEEALTLSRQRITEKNEILRINALISTLTPKEYAVFRFLITGMLNKQIAAEMNITEHTVKIHRGRITEKLGVKSVAEMVMMTEKLNVR